MDNQVDDKEMRDEMRDGNKQQSNRSKYGHIKQNSFHFMLITYPTNHPEGPHMGRC